MRQLAARCICRDTFIVENEQSPGMLSSGSIATCSPAASSHCLLRHSCPMRCLVVSTFRHPLRLKPPLSQCKCCECISLSEKCSMVSCDQFWKLALTYFRYTTVPYDFSLSFPEYIIVPVCVCVCVMAQAHNTKVYTAYKPTHLYNSYVRGSNGGRKV